MRSVNDMVKFLVDYEWKEANVDCANGSKVVLVETILDLDDSLPRIYPYNNPVSDALGELFCEVRTYSQSVKRFVQTKQDQGRQIII